MGLPLRDAVLAKDVEALAAIACERYDTMIADDHVAECLDILAGVFDPALHAGAFLEAKLRECLRVRGYFLPLFISDGDWPARPAWNLLHFNWPAAVSQNGSQASGSHAHESPSRSRIMSQTHFLRPIDRVAMWVAPPQ